VIWGLLAVIIVLLAIIGVLVARQQRSRRLKTEFGPEYGRTVAQHGDQGAAEQELTSRRQRHSQFDIRPLAADARERYVDRWGATQRHFVDEPVEAVGQAHVLVQEVMRDRGYPVEEDFAQRAADLSVEHPDLVENYRSANEISVRARSGQVSTEELRQSMVHFRALFDDLLAPGDSADDGSGIRDDATRSGDGDQSEVAQRATRRG
jgi:hypothetical protein